MSRTSSIAIALIVIGSATSGVVTGCGTDELPPELSGPPVEVPDSGAAGGGNMPPGLNLALGAPCVADGDCDDGLLCLSQRSNDWLGGGTAGGYCTADCSDDPAVCAAVSANAFCVAGTTDEAYCFEACTNGAALPQCGGRVDVACAPLGGGVGAYCSPVCGNDDDCGSRFCDLADGICVDDEAEGLPLGSECDPMDDQCAGRCISLSDDYAFCSGVCNFGNLLGCGTTEETPFGKGGLCLPFFNQDDTVGDLGVCVERCSCDDDCAHPGAVCSPFEDEELEMLLSTKGICVPPPTGAEAGTGGLACDAEPPDAGADAATDAASDAAADAADADSGP